MRTFSEKSKSTQKTTSAKSAIPSRSHIGQSHEVSSILQLQRMIGNQAVQRLLEVNTGDARENSTATDTEIARFGNDSSRIPLYSNGEQRASSRGEGGETIDPETVERDGMRAEYPVDFAGPLQPGDTRAVPYDFVGPLEPDVARSSSFHPTMTVVTAGRATSRCGGFEHKVRWGIPAGANSATGWIVQKVNIQFDVKDCNDRPVTPHPIDNPAHYPFWEAWEFTRGGNVWVGPASGRTAHSGDTFSGSDYGPGTKGKISLIGEVKGITGFTLPAGMTVRNTFPAWALPYTRTQPAQFASTLAGASHVVTSEWNCCPSGTVTQATRVTATP